MKPVELHWCAGTYQPTSSYLSVSSTELNLQKVKGAVHYEATPYPYAEVAFFTDSWGLVATKRVNADGEFELRHVAATTRLHIVCRPYDPTKNCQVFRDIYSV